MEAGSNADFGFNPRCQWWLPGTFDCPMFPVFASQRHERDCLDRGHCLLGATPAPKNDELKKGWPTLTIFSWLYGQAGKWVSGPATAAGLFHLMTHAYFKAMLFLGSGL